MTIKEIKKTNYLLECAIGSLFAYGVGMFCGATYPWLFAYVIGAIYTVVDYHLICKDVTYSLRQHVLCAVFMGVLWLPLFVGILIYNALVLTYKALEKLR